MRQRISMFMPTPGSGICQLSCLSEVMLIFIMFEDGSSQTVFEYMGCSVHQYEQKKQWRDFTVFWVNSEIHENVGGAGNPR